MVTGGLQAVARAARDRDRAIREAHNHYLAAVVAARANGHTLAAIGKAAGVTRQAIWEMIQRHEEHKP